MKSLFPRFALSRSVRVFLAALALSAAAFPWCAAHAQTATVTDLYDFGQAQNGYDPSTLVQGSGGNLYGVTATGGINNTGTVFQLTPTGTLTVLYTFAADPAATTVYTYVAPSHLTKGSDGNFYGTFGGSLVRVTPTGGVTLLFKAYTSTSVVQDSAGNFYGTTDGYDPNTTPGSVYKVTPDGVFTTLHTFGYSTDGYDPTSLVLGNDGNLYGTTIGGGGNGQGFNGGTVFQVTPNGVFTVLHRFTDDTTSFSPASLVQGSDGNFYGTADYQQTYNSTNETFGVASQSVFQITPTGGYKDFHIFVGEGVGYSGNAPVITVFQGSDGNLYCNDEDTIDQLTPTGGLNTIYTPTQSPIEFSSIFQGNDGNFYGVGGENLVRVTPARGSSLLYTFVKGLEGMDPNGIALGGDGNFYGTTFEGGSYTTYTSGSNTYPNAGDGTAFQITPDGTFSLLHQFTGADDGYNPFGLVPDSSGILHGVASYGQENFDGTHSEYAAFQITPAGSGTTFQSFPASTTTVFPTQVVQGPDGNFYGTTYDGGANKAGSVFKQTPDGVQTTLYSFSFTAAANGYYPRTFLVLGSDGNLYGVTSSGGTNGSYYGTIFRLTLAGTLTTIYNVTDYEGITTLLQAKDGNFYGTTDTGKLFQLTPAGVFATLYTFSMGVVNYPPNSLVQTSDGNFYGATTTGGLYGSGMIFRATVTPAALSVPVITGTDGSGIVGYTFSYQIVARNAPTSYGATGLPAGLTLDSSTGLISGTPTQAGTFSVSLSATNANGIGTATLTLTVAAEPPPPGISSIGSANGTVGQAFTYQITATNNPTDYFLEGSQLPPGLNLDETTGLISGVPTQAGKFTVYFGVANNGGDSGGTLMLTIAAAGASTAPVISSPLTASVMLGQAFTYQIAGSQQPTSFYASGLPASLDEDDTTGLISGTPTQTGTFAVNLSATSAGGTGTAVLTLMVTDASVAPPVINSATTASAQIGATFSYQITASNSPTSFGVTALPVGLSINPTTGLISGTPAVSGTFTINLSATNSGGTGTAALTLAVVEVVPVVTVAVSGDGFAKEGGENGKVAVRRTGDLSAALTVRYKVKGDIVVGEDIKAGSVTGSVVIPAGAAQAKIKIRPIDDAAKDGTRVVKIKLKPVADGSYILGVVTTAKVTLIDND